MGPNPLIGVFYHWIGGLASASNFIPFRPIKRWSWEIFWIIQGFAAWIVAPAVFALVFVPNVIQVLHTAPRTALSHAIFWGAMWGIGGLTFGLSIRYLGIALGYAIALGFCTAFGTLMPPIFSGQLIAVSHTIGGRTIFLGIFVCLIAIVVSGCAGHFKEQEVPREEKAMLGERDYSFPKGLAVAIFAGIMSACFAYGLAAGKPIAVVAHAQLLSQHRTDLWQNLPVLVAVLWGGFLANLIWSVVLIVRNRSARQFLGEPGVNPMGISESTSGVLGSAITNTASASLWLSSKDLFRNYALAAAAGILWYLQFFFYSMGQTKMGKYDFSSWTLHMASIIIFATLWGIALREWRDTSRRTRILVGCGLFLLVSSTVIVGYGNYLSVK